jgi:hypothetical protein
MSNLNLSYPTITRLFGGYMKTGRTEARAFLAWFLENYYRLDETEVFDAICDGSYDKGIDGIYVNEQVNQIDVFQTKIAQSPKTLGDVALKEFAGTLLQFKDKASVNNLLATSLNTELVRILQEQGIANKVHEGYEVRGIFITNQHRDINAQSFLDTTPNITLYDEPELQAAYVHPTKTGPIDKEVIFDVTGNPQMPYTFDGGLEMLIAPLPASELLKMEGIVNQELFAWNVRQWLGKTTKVNKDIEKSIRREDEHKYFPAFHNGLTILCRELEATGVSIKISGYAVVNGCQSMTGLHTNRDKITPELKILTKFIKIPPDDPLALKITDHANNQNGTIGRDLKSNHALQTRLQSEIHTKYQGEVYYRIKRGEHPEWNEKAGAIVIENEVAARILLAFDLKQSWASHQTYRLFEELHARIFGRPEVTAERIIALYDILLRAQARLNAFDNQLFGEYSLTRYFMMFLVREALETDKTGKEFIANPAAFIAPPDGRLRLQYASAKVVGILGRILDNEITRRNTPDPSEQDLFGNVKETKTFVYKTELKSPKRVAELRHEVITRYQLYCEVDGLGFSRWWAESEEAVRNASSQAGE